MWRKGLQVAGLALGALLLVMAGLWAGTWARTAMASFPAERADTPGVAAVLASTRTRAVMVSDPRCPVCARARSWLAREGVAGVEVVEDPDHAGARLARSHGIDVVPVLLVDGRVIPGFDEAGWREALAADRR
jgi:glutaredoxin